MKKLTTLVLACLLGLSVATFTGCSKKSDTEKAMDKMEDAAKDMGKAAEGAVEDAKDAVEDATE